MAHILVERRKTDGSILKQSLPVQKPNDLGKFIHDDSLQGFKIVSIDPIAEQVVFDKRGVLTKARPIQYQVQETKIPRQRSIAEAQATYPVPNLLDRVAEATKLTRPTVHKVFQGLNNSQKTMLLSSP